MSKQVRDSCDDNAVKKFADAAGRDDMDLVNDVLSAVEQTHSKLIYQV
jgi:DNA-binding protein Fis